MNQQVFCGNNIDLLKQYPDNYFDAVVTDPPYGLGKEPDANQMLQAWITEGYLEVTGSGFMGKKWDAFVPQPIFWKEVFRVLKHGGHVVSFFGTRTYDWGVMAMRLAGFEVRDCIQWIYGSGFPKSHNISKAIDKMFGAERKIVGEIKRGDVQKAKQNGSGYLSDPANRNNEKQFGYGVEKITIAATDQAKQWDGWGSALKPAYEPIVLARKPLEKGLSIAENVLKWGTGAINIDDCRISHDEEQKFTNREQRKESGWDGLDNTKNNIASASPKGRFPANLILTHHPDCVCMGTKKVKSDAHHTHKYNNKKTLCDASWKGWKDGEDMGNKFADENGEETIEDWNCHEDCPIRIMDEQSGESKSQKSERGNIVGNQVFGKYNEQENTLRGHNDKGGASRFFYCAKASKSERNKGLESFETRQTIGGDGTYNEEAAGKYGSMKAEGKNFHPTVKPVALMRYLVRLITPPNGIVLDPFNGSGTTGVACKLENFNYIGLEQDADYCRISEARILSSQESDYEMDYDFTENEPNDNSDAQLSLFD